MKKRIGLEFLIGDLLILAFWLWYKPTTTFDESIFTLGFGCVAQFFYFLYWFHVITSKHIMIDPIDKSKTLLMYSYLRDNLFIIMFKTIGFLLHLAFYNFFVNYYKMIRVLNINISQSRKSIDVKMKGLT